MCMKKIIWISVCVFLLSNLHGQIILNEITWGGTKNEISLDSVLEMSTESLIFEALQDTEDMPQHLHYDRGRYGKVFLIYEGQAMIGHSPRITGVETLDGALSNISDKILNTMLPYLSLKPKTIYLLGILINIEIEQWHKDEEIEYFINYEKERVHLGQKEYNVITIQDFPPK